MLFEGISWDGLLLKGADEFKRLLEQVPVANVLDGFCGAYDNADNR